MKRTVKGAGRSSRRRDYPEERASGLRPPFSPLLSRSALRSVFHFGQRQVGDIVDARL